MFYRHRSEKMDSNTSIRVTSSLISAVIILICLQTKFQLTNAHVSGSIVTSGCFGNLCNETSNYPYAEIEAAIARFPEYRVYFGTVFSIPGKRNRREIDGGEDCEAERNTMYPRLGMDVKKELVTIVNVDEFKQEVPYTLCLSEKCQQKYRLIELVILGDGGNLSRSKFTVPAGCRILPGVAG